MSRNILTYLFICSLLVWSGCSGATVKDKERSIASMGEVTITGVPLKAYLGQRIALALKNVQLENGEIDSDQLQATFKKHGGHGLACAVSEDGYFLTAFHVVQGAESLHLFTGPDLETSFRTTVIWSSEEHDLAVLRSAARATPFHLSTRVKEDSVCLCGGGHGGHSAGKILETSTRGDFDQILHSAPSVPGDSGGPLILQDGSLVGINVSWHKKITIPILGLGLLGVEVNKYSEAIRINPRLLEEIISKDRDRDGSASSTELGGDLDPTQIGGSQNANEQEE